MTPKNVYYSKKYLALRAESAKPAPPAARPAPGRRTPRAGLAALGGCLLLALLLVLVVPALAGGGTAAGLDGPALAGAAEPRHVVTYESAQEALAAVGGGIVLPAWLPKGTQEVSYSVADGTLLELSYRSGNTVWLFRAQAGKANLCDITISNCVYYTVEEAGGVTREYAGDTAGRPAYAAWQSGDVSYAIVAPSGSIDARLLRQIAESIPN